MAIAASLFALTCRHSGPSQEGLGAIPVVVHQLSEQTIVDYDDYLASLTSRRSVTIYPQVSGYVRAIRVKAGQSVAQEALLLVIDPGQQEGNLRNLVANLASRRANLAYAIKNDESSQHLVRAGLLSQLDYEQRHAQRLATEADVKAAEAQVRAQSEILRFYRITSPTDGTVGDVPVKVGDYVNPQTRLTSVDQGNRLEAYVYIPVDKVDSISSDSAIALLGEDDKVLCEQRPTFVSPEVDVSTQTILVKTVCPNAGDLRTAQVLKGRMIWARHGGLLVPTSAVTRLSGQYFVFVAEHGQNGTIARQRPIAVGAIQGNDYVVKGGLSAGDELVVSNVQKIRDGAPISVTPPNPPSSAPSGSGPPPQR